MPMRFYFHLRDDSGLREDSEGMEFPSSHVAGKEAWEGARDMIADRIRTGRRIKVDSTFEVTDEAGAIVQTVSFADVLTSCL